MNYDDFPSTWLHKLEFKTFSFNERQNLLPNLWCIFASDINPTLIDIDDQQVSFSITVDNNLVYMSAIYASTDHLRRRNLWDKLSLLQSHFNAPWAFIGDFNVILGAHAYCGNFIPARISIADFQHWTDIHDLVHLPTRGVSFT